MNPFIQHPQGAEHKSGEMQGWYARIRVFLNQLLVGANITAGSNITITPSNSGYTIAATGGGSGNLDGGDADSIYGGTTPVDGGSA